eukprot:TRINITY_DN33236_c0_g1_i1.p1 TRINITY_DN33236_c0_g1~~TRINITY_DN33236_c0_g1_i1.p1  ORF type:complete len:396 (+),score=79.84 TRINITY_DN33236_c0_g1_i1:49-1236(+)
MVIVALSVASISAANFYCLYRNCSSSASDAWRLDTEGEYEGLRVPPSFRCPISQEVMRDPVVTADGHTYERSSIEEWFRQGRRTSPLTNVSLPNRELLSNLALREAVGHYASGLRPLLRDEADQRKSLERQLMEATRQHQADQKQQAELRSEIADRESRQEEAMQALLASLEEREAEVATLRTAREEAMLHIESLQNGRAEELLRVRESHDLELAELRQEAARAVKLAEDSAEAACVQLETELSVLRKERDEAVRVLSELRQAVAMVSEEGPVVEVVSDGLGEESEGDHSWKLPLPRLEYSSFCTEEDSPKTKHSRKRASRERGGDICRHQRRQRSEKHVTALLLDDEMGSATEENVPAQRRALSALPMGRPVPPSRDRSGHFRSLFRRQVAHDN